MTFHLIQDHAQRPSVHAVLDSQRQEWDFGINVLRGVVDKRGNALISKAL
jgi:hypothetical protein